MVPISTFVRSSSNISRFRGSRHVHSEEYAKDDDDDVNDTQQQQQQQQERLEILNSISDAEALLACRAHLQRRKLLSKKSNDINSNNNNNNDGWQNAEWRKAKRLQHAENARQSDAVGFFWEDPDELAFYDRAKRPHLIQQRQPSVSASSSSKESTNTTTSQSRSIDISGSEYYALEVPSSPSVLVSNDEDVIKEVDGGDEDEDDATANRGDEIWETTVTNPRSRMTSETSSSIFDGTETSSSTQNGNDEEDVWENAHLLAPDTWPNDAARTYYRIDEDTPRQTHMKRSLAAKKKFTNETWKELWYVSRWGRPPPSQRNNHNSTDHIRMKSKTALRKLDGRIRKIDGFLESPELNAMTEDEIAEAITKYVTSYQKRVVSRRKTLQERKAALNKQYRIGQQFVQNDTFSYLPETEVQNSNMNNTINDTIPIPRDILLRTDPLELEERQRHRAVQATKAYQKRLQNSNKPETKRRKKQSPFPSIAAIHITPQLTPENSIRYIESMLDNLQDESFAFHNASTLEELKSHVECILQSTKLARRKYTLRRVLSQVFDLRGKCIPTTNNSAYEFVTQASVANIGEFVLRKIHERIISLDESKGDITNAIVAL
jgi:hypothetical protein